MPIVALLLMAALIAIAPAALPAQLRHVKVAVEFRHEGTQTRDGAQGSGGVIITERGDVRGGGRIGVEDTQTRVRQSTGIFTIVQDGGESTLTVATQVPSQHLTFYRDYATGAGYVVAGVTFRDVGTSLKVQARILPQNRIQVRLTPVIGYVGSGGAGTVAFTEAATELVVDAGHPIAIGGATTHVHQVTRRMLGIAERHTRDDTAVFLTATIR